MADALERVTNLLALLLATRRPLTLDQIAAELRSYPATASARRGSFERDKAVLRELGIPIETEVLSGEQAGVSGYWIDRDRYELTGLTLDTDERQALQLAVAAVRTGEAQFGLLKLGGAAGEDASFVANVPALDALPELREAAATRSLVRFTYHGRPRVLHPYTLLLREGFWYVMGEDTAHGEVRTYRVDRIEGDVAVGPAQSFLRPADFDPLAVFPTDPKELGDASARATVLVDASRARFAVDELGDDAVLERRPGGAVVLEVACANLDAFRSWLFGLGVHAEVLQPPAVREAVVGWLAGMIASAPP